MPWPKEKALKLIHDVGLIPIVRTVSSDDAKRAAEAILAGGVGIVEITMTVPNALRVVEQLAERLGEQVLIGAGTILDVKTCEAAIEAGAEFIVTPSFDARVIKMANKHEKPCLPGALTPTEVLGAWNAGADFVKVFPCGPVGGPSYIKALKGPFPHIKMVPTGGVTLDNVADFIRAGASAVAVGGEMVDLEALRNGDLTATTSKAHLFAEAVRSGRDTMAQMRTRLSYRRFGAVEAS